jgi:hypothetical protein
MDHALGHFGSPPTPPHDSDDSIPYAMRACSTNLTAKITRSPQVRPTIVRVQHVFGRDAQRFNRSCPELWSVVYVIVMSMSSSPPLCPSPSPSSSDLKTLSNPVQPSPYILEPLASTKHLTPPMSFFMSQLLDMSVLVYPDGKTAFVGLIPGTGYLFARSGSGPTTSLLSPLANRSSFPARGSPSLVMEVRR